MRFRQVHLDFHTAGSIEQVGCDFNKADFQHNLQQAHANSVTLTAKCAHGWVYYDSKLTPKHPHLSFDLLRQQMEAAHEIGLLTPIHISVCLDERMVNQHPEWLIRRNDEKTTWVPTLMEAGWHRFCLNNPHASHVTQQILEVVRNYAIDGLFLDVSSPIPCCCQACVRTLLEQGKDPLNHAHIWELAETLYKEYILTVKQKVHEIKPGLPIFHNGGHIQRGRSDLISGDTHLELESLPTGGWGYDHFPISALYAANLGMNYLGMTGKFQKAWGEFGGYKHPNALLYETSLNLVYGARCSVGDQMHPTARLDAATYKMIGTAYSQVEQKEKYLEGAHLGADIGLLSLEALGAYYGEHNLVAIAETVTLGEEYNEENHIAQAQRSDVGAFRLLNEGGYLFRVVDAEMNFNDYKVMLLPDYANLDDKLAAKLAAYVKAGGKVFVTGVSGWVNETGNFFKDLGLGNIKKAQYSPVYLRARESVEPLGDTAFVLYENAFELEANPQRVEVLADFEYPYFNRTPFEFFSHAHAPSQNKAEGVAVAAGDEFIYVASNLFEEYRKHGAFLVKDLFVKCMDKLLGNQKTLETTLPAPSTVTLMHNPERAFDLIQLLYVPMSRKGEGMATVEDIVPVYNVDVRFRTDTTVRQVTLVPQERAVDYEFQNGVLHFQVDELNCHQMVQVQY